MNNKHITFSRTGSNYRLLAVCFLLGLVAFISGPLLDKSQTGAGAQVVSHETAKLKGVLPQLPSSAGARAVAGNNSTPPPIAFPKGVKVGHSEKNDVSPALRSMRPLAAQQVKGEDENDSPLPSRRPGNTAGIIDPVVQSSFKGGAQALLSNPIVSVEGVNHNNGGTGYPPDTNGAVGFNHYVQIVNGSFKMFNKSGTLLYGPAATNTLWQGFGGYCESHNDGDPIVIYDHIASRWVITQFAIGAAPNHTPSYECIAISTSDDPTAAYYRYAFFLSDSLFYDYPKFGSWPFAYFMSANKFSGTTFMGASAIAFDRTRMFSGQPASYQEFSTGQGGLLPADLDGTTLPPEGSPNYFISEDGGGGLDMFKFHVDFQNPANSTFDSSYISVAPFTGTICADEHSNCIPEPETGLSLDSTSDRLMNRLAYRNFGDHESLVLNHTVRANTGVSGIRWYELRAPNNFSPVVYQQGTYALADNGYRWQGSIAQDRDGNIALGMNVSGFYPLYPSLVYTGRLSSDPLGQFTQGENVLYRGTGSQTNYNRWGDYSALTVDPYDDCTFWYTGEYYQSNGTDWHTRIGSFKFPSCAQYTPTPTRTRTSTPTPTVTPTITPAVTVTPAPCGNYVVSQTTGATIVPGTTDTGNHCDDCLTNVALPFAFQFYNQSFTNVNISSNGNLQFSSAASDFGNACLPYPALSNAILAYWDDLLTNGTGEGIYTSVSGTAPNRIFNIEWRGHHFNNTGAINFEVRLYEGSSSRFDIVYGAVPEGGSSATVGAQRDTGSFVTQFECNTPSTISAGMQLSFIRPNCTACTGDYTVSTETGGSIVPGTTDTGNHCDDCATLIPLPFSYTLYDRSFTSVSASSNGQLDFGTADPNFNNACLPDAAAAYAIFPHWDDLVTDGQGNCPAGGCGIFTSVSGTAPFRVFNIEWRAAYYNDFSPLNFEVRLYEGFDYFEIIYGTGAQAGSSATVGAQMGSGSHVTQYECNTGGIPAGTLLRFNLVCQTSTPTATSTATSTVTATRTSTATATSTPTASPTAASAIISGHLTWQGIAQPSSRNTGMTATLTLCVNGAPSDNVVTTDQNGNFTLNTNLNPGTYSWRIKGARNLASAGTLTYAGGTLNTEFGVQAAGDANNTNIVNAQDFNLLKSQFGAGGAPVNCP